MADELTKFAWRVPSTGHRWIDGQSIGGDSSSAQRFLVEEAQPGELAPADEYNPLHEPSHSALFKTFAETESSEEGIQHFADRFGRLGGSAKESVEVQGGTGRFSEGEPLHIWRSEILAMRTLIRLWDLVENRDQAGLREFIEWKEDAAFLRLPSTAGRGHARVSAAIKESPQLKRGETLTAAVYFLQDLVNDKLAHHGVRARLLWDAKRAEYGLRLVPESLIGCLWLQLAKAMEKDRNYRRCGNCEAWFELGGSRGARADKKFCSPSCKATAHRRKHEEACRRSRGF
ncbi:MAG: hypothetical protein LAP87_20915 [Acidobacteriia bacterium]|nr:hypothetical protein [Terriglobia bacterium]